MSQFSDEIEVYGFIIVPVGNHKMSNILYILSGVLHMKPNLNMHKYQITIFT